MESRDVNRLDSPDLLRVFSNVPRDRTDLSAGAVIFLNVIGIGKFTKIQAYRFHY